VNTPTKRFVIPVRGEVSEWEYSQWRRDSAERFKRADFPTRHAEWLRGERAGRHKSENARWRKHRHHVQAGLTNGGVILAFIGGRGTGKTLLATAAGWYVCERNCTARYWRAAFLSENIKRGWDDQATPDERKALSLAVKVRLLVVDEIGERNESEWERRTLNNIVCQRHDYGLDTILIANQSADEFAGTVGDSITDRIAQDGGIFEFPWPSFRRVSRPC
jgi:DNA replication protein DnaC